jgi:hypothetical protein
VGEGLGHPRGVPICVRRLLAVLEQKASRGPR